MLLSHLSGLVVMVASAHLPVELNRMGRVVQVLDKDFTLPIGKAKVMRQGKDVTVTAFSKMVGLTLDAAAELEKEGIDVEVRMQHRAGARGQGGIQRGGAAGCAQGPGPQAHRCVSAGSSNIAPACHLVGNHPAVAFVSLSVLLAGAAWCLGSGDQPAQHQASGP
jgi:hypothetical protein